MSDKPEIIIPRRNQSLTKRERDILRLYASGARLVAIAAQFGISRGTVGSHLTKIRAKTRVSGRDGLVAVAIKEGLLKG